jgi:hypothetical protein
MKTTNTIILVGVLGVGAVGAYMYMKNKQAQNALLTGSLPATNQGGATTPSGTTPSGTPTLSTTSDGVSPNDANLNLANATILAVDIRLRKNGGTYAQDYLNKNIVKYMESRLAKFGYKLLEKPDPSNPVVRNAFTYELVKL